MTSDRHVYPSADEREALAAACENFAQRAKLIPLPKDLKRAELAKVGFAVMNYRRAMEWPSRKLDSDAVGMAAVVYAMAGQAATAAELLEEMLPPDEDLRWNTGYAKARRMRDQLKSAVYPFRRGLPDA